MQIDVAQKANIDGNTLSSYENGLREPNFNALEKLAELYEVSVTEIFGEPRNTQNFESNTDTLEKIFRLVLEMNTREKHMVLSFLEAYKQRKE